MMPAVLLSSAYFGPIQWFQKIARSRLTLIERHDSYCMQTYRNRCVIAANHGPLTLTVPVERADNDPKGVRISDHGAWRHNHWQALASAYGESPFFDYYADDIRPFFERRWTFLYDYNLEICSTLCSLLDLDADIRETECFIPPRQEDRLEGMADFREAIHPKHPAPDADFEVKPYYQVFAEEQGFLPNLSILDLLFNMGPEGVFWLEEIKKPIISQRHEN